MLRKKEKSFIYVQAVLEFLVVQTNMVTFDIHKKGNCRNNKQTWRQELLGIYKLWEQQINASFRNGIHNYKPETTQASSKSSTVETTSPFKKSLYIEGRSNSVPSQILGNEILSLSRSLNITKKSYARRGSQKVFSRT